MLISSIFASACELLCARFVYLSYCIVLILRIDALDEMSCHVSKCEKLCIPVIKRRGQTAKAPRNFSNGALETRSAKSPWNRLQSTRDAPDKDRAVLKKNCLRPETAVPSLWKISQDDAACAEPSRKPSWQGSRRTSYGLYSASPQAS